MAGLLHNRRHPPAPLEATPEGFHERDEAVIEAIIQQVPANATGAERAAMAVAGNQPWMHFRREVACAEHDKPEHDRGRRGKILT